MCGIPSEFVDFSTQRAYFNLAQLKMQMLPGNGSLKADKGRRRAAIYSLNYKAT